MAETVGSLIDKISILELRRWHTEGVMLNASAPVEMRHDCALRLHTIDEQRIDLVRELSDLWDAIARGEHMPKVYRQLKMYNDEALRVISSPETNTAATPKHDRGDSEKNDADKDTGGEVIQLSFRRRTATEDP